MPSRANVSTNSSIFDETAPVIEEELPTKEHVWAIELNKDKKSYTWSLKEENEEDDDEDEDYMQHTLFMRNAILGPGAVEGERNIVEVTTKGYQEEDVKFPLVSLTLGKNDLCMVDMTFSQSHPVTFTLIQGDGPIHLSAILLVEYPKEDEQYIPDLAEESEECEEPKGVKRKAGKLAGKKRRKLNTGSSATSGEDGTEEDGTEGDEGDEEEEESMEDENEDEEDEEEEDEEEEEERETKRTKSKKQKPVTKTKAKRSQSPAERKLKAIGKSGKVSGKRQSTGR